MDPHMYRNQKTPTKTTSSGYGTFYEGLKRIHLSIPPDIVGLVKYVDLHVDEYVEDLREAVQIPSVSGELKHLKDMDKMLRLLERWLVKLGVKYEIFDVGNHTLEGTTKMMPPALIGSLGFDCSKKNLCIYGHIDVTSPTDQKWDTDPWTIQEKDGCYFGKGTALGKGPLIAWFHAIRVYQKHKMPLPVNIKFIIEGMHEHGSPGLEKLLKSRTAKFAASIDQIVVCDTEWLGTKIPCITYGCVGICRFEITVSKVKDNPDADPKMEMEMIFAKLFDKDGKILIPNLYKIVDPLTPEEEALYDTIDFNFEEIRCTLPPHRQHWDKNLMLMHFWRLLDVVLGDMEEISCPESPKTVSAVKRGFVIKIVPRLTPDYVAQNINESVYAACKEICCQCRVECEMISGSRTWLENYMTPGYVAAWRASVQIYHSKPNIIRSDRDIAAICVLNKIINKNILLLPLVRNGSHLGKANEHISKKNFTESIKLMIAFLRELSIQKCI